MPPLRHQAQRPENPHAGVLCYVTVLIKVVGRAALGVDHVQEAGRRALVDLAAEEDLAVGDVWVVGDAPLP